MITVLHEQRVSTHPPASNPGTDSGADAGTDAGTSIDAAALWLDAPAIEAATGWQWKPEGLCQGDVCMPLPPAARAQWVQQQPGEAALLDLAAMWRHSGQPVVHDPARQTWVLGTGAAQRRAALETLEAPGFTLPDLDGVPHSLADYRGRKVFLATWASW